MFEESEHGKVVDMKSKEPKEGEKDLWGRWRKGGYKEEKEY